MKDAAVRTQQTGTIGYIRVLESKTGQDGQTVCEGRKFITQRLNLWERRGKTQDIAPLQGLR